MITMATPLANIEPMKGSAGVNPLNITPEQFNARFRDGTYVLEPKYDGFRFLVRKQGRSVTHQLTKDVPDYLIEAVRELPDGIYDGEMHVPGGHSWDAGAIETEKVLTLFDVLVLQGVDLTATKLTSRRECLELAVEHHTKQGGWLINVAPRLPVHWSSIELVWANGGEGGMLKRRESLYKPGKRTADWIKVKQLESHVVTITGYEPGSYGPCSVVEFRFDDGTHGTAKNLNTDWRRRMEANMAGFIGRKVVIECQLRTADGRPRHPMLKRFAVDHMVEAGEVTR